MMWGKMVYREITPKDRMVFINSFSDEAGGPTAIPLSADLADGNDHDLHVRGRARQQGPSSPSAGRRTTPPRGESKTFDAGHARA